MASPPTASPSHLISDLEAQNYYHGLYSKPVLVARTGQDMWVPPTGPEAYFRPKMLQPVGNHPLENLWEDSLAPKIHALLETAGVQWTSTDVLRIGFVGESTTPVCIWIGVEPGSLSRESGNSVALQVKELVILNGITDVEIEIRESVIKRHIGPRLPKPVRSHDPAAEFLQPLTSTLGLTICNAGSPLIEGTGGFYVMDRDSNLYLVTARHVALPPDPRRPDSTPYKLKNTSQRRIKIAQFGTTGYQKYVAKIKQGIEHKTMIIEDQQRRINLALQGQNQNSWTDDVLEKDDANRIVTEAHRAKLSLANLLTEVEKSWSGIENRILGHISFAPPLTYHALPHEFTQDYALISIDPTKINSTNFTGNALDLGTQIDSVAFKQLMFLKPENSHNFTYPMDRLLRISGVLSDSEMNNPKILDQADSKCLIVIKRGYGTGLTIGKANNLASFTRVSAEDGNLYRSKEWPICPYDNRSGPFSAPGDSGAAIVDCFGRLGGLLTGGGGGARESTDITYATPAWFILQSLRSNGFPVTIHTTFSP